MDRTWLRSWGSAHANSAFNEGHYSLLVTPLTAVQERTTGLTMTLLSFTTLLFWHCYAPSYLSESIYSSCRSCRHCMSRKPSYHPAALRPTFPRLGVSEYKAVTPLSAQWLFPALYLLTYCLDCFLLRLLISLSYFLILLLHAVRQISFPYFTFVPSKL